MSKYCPARKIECEYILYNSNTGLYRCGDENRQCPRPELQVPVKQTIDTVNSYQAGRADMKREIGGAVRAKQGDFDDETIGLLTALAAIEGVK